MSTPQVRETVDRAHRDEWGRVLAAAARLAGGDLGLAEEATQDAFVAALETWGERGIPARPGAWLTATARRRVLDRLRRESTLRGKLPLLLADDVDDVDEVDAIPDDRLRLVFTCCHPALAMESRTALTLRLVCGLTTAEIARAFLVPEPTMAARLTRAKKKIAAAGIPYRVPGPADLAERLDGVLTVVYLAFTAGHTAGDGGDALVRDDLVSRSLDLGRVLAILLPDEPDVLGLLALMTLTDARRATRVDADGRLVLLADQDRSRWDADVIRHGLALLDRALGLIGPDRPAGRFVLQAAIAAVHAEAGTFAETDWAAVVALYDRLRVVWPGPVVEVNRAVALSYLSGPEAGLAALDLLRDDPRLASFHYLPAARADLLRRLGRRDEAAQSYAEALAGCPGGPERAFLAARLAEVTADPG